MDKHPSSLNTNNAQSVIHDGCEWLVVPGVPIREQVMNTYLVPAEEIVRSLKGWNGTPISIQHPQLNEGSANVPAPDVAIIGRFFNAAWDEGARKMIGEYWINLAEAMKYVEGMKIVESIRNGAMLETSTGYWAEDETIPGEFEGKQYKTVHRNLLPDHIAILPNEIGACSLQDGCGLNRNKRMVLNCGGSAGTCDCPFKNSDSIDKQLSEIRLAFDKKFRDYRGMETATPIVFPYVREIFDTYMIVEKGADLYRVGYALTPEGPEIEDPSNWQKVEISYIATNAQIPEYKKDHLPTQMLVGYSFHEGSRTQEELDALRALIKEKGITKPVVIMTEGEHIKIMDGNHRVSMAGEMGIDQIPVQAYDDNMQPIDPEMLYMKWKHSQDHEYLKANPSGMLSEGDLKKWQNKAGHSRAGESGPALINPTKESKMKYQDLVKYLDAKGLKVTQNGDNYEVEETPVAVPVPPPSPFAVDEISTLKAIAQNTAIAKLDVARIEGALTLAQNLEAQQKAEKKSLIASIKTNESNTLSDEELNGMTIPTLTKINAQFGVNYGPLVGGSQNLFQNEDVLVVSGTLLTARKEE